MQAARLPTQDRVNPGDRVIIVLEKSLHLTRGVCRYAGDHPEAKPNAAKDLHYGVELDVPKGTHTGMGLFTAKENHGVFVKEKYVRKILDENFDEKELLNLLKKQQKEEKERREAAAANPPPAATNPAPAEPVKPAEPTPAPTPAAQTTPAPAAPKPAAAGPSVATLAKQADENSLGPLKREVEELKETVRRREDEITKLKAKSRTLEEQLTKEKEKNFGKSSDTANLEKQFEFMESKYNEMSIQYESLKVELETSKQTFDEQLTEAKIRIQELELDKEEMMLNAELAAEDDAGAMDESDVAELKKNFGFLKMAFSQLEERSKSDKQRLETKLADMDAKLKNNDGVSSEALKKQLKDKDDIINGLKLRLDENSESNSYISELTDKLIGSQATIKTLNETIGQLKNTIRTNEDLIEEYEEMNGLLEAESSASDDRIKVLEEKIKVLDEEKKAQEAALSRYREKMKLIQGEIDLIKSEASENTAQDKISQIEKLVKKYEFCLREKRSVLKKLIECESKEIKDSKKLLTWNVVMKSIPNKFVSDLDSINIEKFLSLMETIKKVDLAANQLKSNYLMNPIVVEESIELVTHISVGVAALLQTRRIIEYVYDYGFSLHKMDELKELTRSQIFVILVSQTMLLDKLIKEIQEDNFSIKFSFKLLEENNEKMLQKVNEITNDLNDVKLRNSIDMRYFSKYVDLQYLVLCDYAEFKKVATEVHKQNVPKLSNIAQSVSYDQSWIRIQEELVKLRNAAVQPPAEGGEAAPAPKAVTVADLAAHPDGPASTFQKDKLAGLYEVLHKHFSDGVDVEQIAAILQGLEEPTAKYLAANSKKPVKSEEEKEYPFELCLETGPWSEVVAHVKRKLEKTEETQRDNVEKGAKIEDLSKKLLETELKVESGTKVKATLENRIKDLEFKNQNIPLIEGEKTRAVEQAKILTSEVEKLKRENEVLNDKVKLGGVSTGSTAAKPMNPLSSALGGALFKAAQNKAAESGADSKLFSHMKLPGAPKEMVTGTGSNETLATKAIMGYERIIEGLQSQLLSKDEDDIFNPSKMMKDMPHFFKIYSREKKRALFGNTIETEGRNTLGKISLIGQQVRDKIVKRKVVDLSKTKETDPQKRLNALTEQAKLSDKEIVQDKERALAILESFQAKWVQTYSSLSSPQGASSQLSKLNTQAIGQEHLLGTIKFERVAKDKPAGVTDSGSRVYLRHSELVLKKAIALT